GLPDRRGYPVGPAGRTAAALPRPARAPPPRALAGAAERARADRAARDPAKGQAPAERGGGGPPRLLAPVRHPAGGGGPRGGRRAAGVRAAPQPRRALRAVGRAAGRAGRGPARG